MICLDIIFDPCCFFSSAPKLRLFLSILPFFKKNILSFSVLFVFSPLFIAQSFACHFLFTLIDTLPQALYHPQIRSKCFTTMLMQMKRVAPIKVLEKRVGFRDSMSLNKCRKSSIYALIKSLTQYCFSVTFQKTFLKKVVEASSTNDFDYHPTVKYVLHYQSNFNPTDSTIQSMFEAAKLMEGRDEWPVQTCPGPRPSPKGTPGV